MDHRWIKAGNAARLVISLAPWLTYTRHVCIHGWLRAQLWPLYSLHMPHVCTQHRHSIPKGTIYEGPTEPSWALPEAAQVRNMSFGAGLGFYGPGMAPYQPGQVMSRMRHTT